MDPITYLAIGHVSQDLTPAGPALGGSVTFSALTARALGCQAAILTSAPGGAPPLLQPLESLHLHRVPADHFTTFENIYTPQGRVQTLSARATPLGVGDLPPHWHSPSIVHLAPVADEVDPALVGAFPQALIGLTPQGWMRCWDASGHVSYQPWAAAPDLLPRVGAVILSIEDIRGDEALAEAYARQAAILVVTRGELGCTLYSQGDVTHIPAPRVEVKDPTGAGDIFAAAFLIRLHAAGDPISAARFATRLASASVTRVGLESLPDAATIREALSHS